MEGYLVFTLFVFFVHGVVADDFELVSVNKGDSVPLHTDVTKQQLDNMLWYFNDILIAQINGEARKSCLYDGEDGRFRDRVEVDYETGSLNITNIRSEHAGRYEAELIRSKSSGTSTSLNRTSKCDSTKIIRKMSNIGDTIKIFVVSVSSSLSAPDKTSEELDETGKELESDRRSFLITVSVMCAVFLISVIAGVIYCRHWRSVKAKVEKKRLQQLLKV